MNEFQFIKSYQNNDALRQSFNELAKQTFDIDFEDWYQNGFWSGNYIPYSMLDGDRVAANVSVNRMYFIWNGEKKHFIQLGTVMTRPEYRNQGLIRRLMEEIERDFALEAEGMYLFANDSVLSFYPKFGYERETEYQYAKKVDSKGPVTARQVFMREKQNWGGLVQAIKKSVNHSKFEMVDNPQLIMFYATKYMQENVYYVEELDSYVIAEIEGGNLLIHAVYSQIPVDRHVLDRVIASFGGEICKVTLGFTPINTEGYTACEIQEDDTTLFIKGKGLTGFHKHNIMFPTLSHA